MLLFFECALCFLAILPFALTLDPSDIVITILSQKEGYHSAQANFLKKSILESADALQKDHPHVVLSHEIDDEEISRGSWTFYPLIPMLATKYADSQWYFFCLENTAIRLEKLLTTLAAFNSSSDMWLGHVLRDKERTIIHHFRDTKKSLKYPNLVSGFAISQSLMKTLNERLANEGFPVDQFSIDAPHEFALYIYNDGNGTRLTHSTAFCVVPRRKCATYPKLFYRCGEPVSTDKIFFAVKTFDENHGTRIPILQQTWLKLAKNHALFSNKEDPNLKDIVVVADTKKGHCLKTFEMLQYANKIAEEKGFDWIVVADDDTIISIARLSRLLSCYNPNDSVAIGERYGFYARDPSGYDYLTGGAGLVLSASLVNEIVTSETCTCPTPTTPDDMYLFGNCLQKLGYPPIHSIMFHQARPNDYADKLLASQEPLSFHQFWVIDPIKVYVLWFADDDDGFESHPLHPEL